MASTRNKLKQIYNWMKTRCYNSNRKDWPNYGGRGIKVCDRWLKFENFQEDMLISYKKGLTLDRINNNENYSKENCRWATRAEQSVNTRRNHFFEYKGISDTLTNWAKYLGIKRSTLAQRIYVYHWSIDRTLGGQIG